MNSGRTCRSKARGEGVLGEYGNVSLALLPLNFETLAHQTEISQSHFTHTATLHHVPSIRSHARSNYQRNPSRHSNISTGGQMNRPDYGCSGHHFKAATCAFCVRAVLFSHHRENYGSSLKVLMLGRSRPSLCC